jgi:hypothetical protein
MIVMLKLLADRGGQHYNIDVKQWSVDTLHIVLTV